MQDVRQDSQFVYNFCKIFFFWGVWLQENQKDKDKELNQVQNQNLDSGHVSHKHNHISGYKIPDVWPKGAENCRYFAESEFLYRMHHLRISLCQLLLYLKFTDVKTTPELKVFWISVFQVLVPDARQDN